jgi:hypothetical protein
MPFTSVSLTPRLPTTSLRPFWAQYTSDGIRLSPNTSSVATTTIPPDTTMRQSRRASNVTPTPSTSSTSVNSA